MGALGLTCLFVALTQAYVGFHGDAMAINRHSLNAGRFLRLGVMTTLCAAIDPGWELARRLVARGLRSPTARARGRA